ncbi:NADH:flavin oxidoreductase/NADH oxidase [Pontibacter diazotrophicus]|uniref:NADH:flavin oxidoreductase/NADH oxidase n=1 Tax=Pontibacter diazotrophicus TaxID=1400979 RepID=A0A3D8LC40_9BACT|nr:NADH:flavin oxidoreductase/NADH oxidase [Pontibacter diazotrophicus]RDV14903.1 NADH:flavin oxidoreductase/NADH oxidase [Pontibacter diazotrophicus]
MAELFSPLTIKEITLRNRIAVSPMCQYSSEDGFITDWHLVHLGSRAVGGAGLVIVEATAVSPEGRITPDDVGLWKEEHIAGLQRINTFLESQGAVPGVQLAHAGRKASHRSPWNGGTAIAPSEERGWQTVAPSALPFTPEEPVPTALDDAGIRKVIDDYRAATERAVRAGFKVVEIHAAHGYLLHEFYSPLSNQRTDSYGGSFDNRIRLLLEVTEAVQEVWPAKYPLLVRISATDWTEGGWTGEDSIALARVLKEKGVDLIDCSTGGNVPKADIPVGPLYQAQFAASLKKETGIMTGAVGMITTAQEAENLISEGKADIVLLAREMLRDPYFPLHAALELGADVPWPVQYERAKPRKR